MLDALVVAEEEEFFVDDWAAEGSSVEVAPVLGFAGSCDGEVVPGVEDFVAEELVKAAVISVATGAGG